MALKLGFMRVEEILGLTALSENLSGKAKIKQSEI